MPQRLSGNASSRHTAFENWWASFRGAIRAAWHPAVKPRGGREGAMIMCGSPAQPDRARSAAIKVFRTPSLRQFSNHFNAPPLAADEIVHGRRHAFVGDM